MDFECVDDAHCLLKPCIHYSILVADLVSDQVGDQVFDP